MGASGEGGGGSLVNAHHDYKGIEITIQKLNNVTLDRCITLHSANVLVHLMGVNLKKL
jgi:hypothetical protein